MEDFSTRLKEAIRNKNIKPSDLSKLTGISKSRLSHWIAGDWEARQDSLTILAEALDTNEAWLMGYDVPNVTREEMLRIANELENK